MIRQWIASGIQKRPFWSICGPKADPWFWSSTMPGNDVFWSGPKAGPWAWLLGIGDAFSPGPKADPWFGPFDPVRKKPAPAGVPKSEFCEYGNWLFESAMIFPSLFFWFCSVVWWYCLLNYLKSDAYLYSSVWFGNLETFTKTMDLWFLKPTAKAILSRALRCFLLTLQKPSELKESFIQPRHEEQTNCFLLYSKPGSSHILDNLSPGAWFCPSSAENSQTQYGQDRMPTYGCALHAIVVYFRSTGLVCMLLCMPFVFLLSTSHGVESHSA